jgi:hypothetical protein
MPAEWLQDHMASKRVDRLAEEADLRKARLAEEGAPRFFANLADRVAHDIDDYHQLGGDPDVCLDGQSAREFKVRKPRYPAKALRVELKTASIDYSYWQKPDDTSPGRWRPAQRFRLTADLDGNIQAAQGEMVFVDESEVSALLLKLIL